MVWGMVASAAMGLAKPFAESLGGIVGEYVTDKDKKNELIAKIEVASMDLISKAIDLGAENTKIELSGKPFQRNWRPLLMYIIITIIGCNFLVFPLIELTPWIAKGTLTLDLPDHLYGFMEIGIGGYVVGRSFEKVAPVVTNLVVKKKEDK